MRFLKRIVIGVLIWAAVYMPFVAVLQALSGSDFSAAYGFGGMVPVVELALSAIIKREESRYEQKQTDKHKQEEMEL